MFTNLKWWLFQIFNYLYKKNFYFLYLPLYTLYKFITEYKEIQLLRRYIKENDIVVDAGANIGFYSLIFSKLVGKNGLVICFEPDLKNFEVLAKRTKKYSNILCINTALSEHSGSLDFYLSEDLNVDHRSYPTNENRKKISVKCYSLDDFLKENNIPKNWLEEVKEMSLQTDFLWDNCEKKIYYESILFCKTQDIS